MRRTLTIVVVLLSLPSCAREGSERWSAAEIAQILRLELPSDLAPPPDLTNRHADSLDASRLGQRLFFDQSLSSSGRFACATCHRPDQGFVDGADVAEGLLPGRRNTPSIIGRAFSSWTFWDGRKDSLWSQALAPFENPVEHNITRLEVVRKVFEKHRAQYESVFGLFPLDPTDDSLPVRAKPDPAGVETDAGRAWAALPARTQRDINAAFANVGKAIAAYERQLLPQRGPFDHYAEALRQGEDRSDLLSADAIEGLRLFIGKANCISCHDTPLFTDDAFHNLGVPPRPDEEAPDSGRRDGARRVLSDEFNCSSPFSDSTAHCAELRYLDPSFPDFDGAFRTPSLRDVARTAPYMHAGQLKTLSDVVRFYSQLPGSPQLGHRELTLVPLALTPQEEAQLVAFLESLTGEPLPAELLRAP